MEQFPADVDLLWSVGGSAALKQCFDLFMGRTKFLDTFRKKVFHLLKEPGDNRCSHADLNAVVIGVKSSLHIVHLPIVPGSFVFFLLFISLCMSDRNQIYQRQKQ